MVGAANERAKASAASQAERRLAAQYGAARVLASADRLDTAAQQLLEVVGTSGGWTLGEIWNVDEAAGVIRCVDLWQSHESAGLDEFVRLSRTLVRRPSEGLTGRIWSSGRPAWTVDLSADPNFPRKDAAARAGLRSGMGLPISSRGQVLGVIEFFSEDRRDEDPAWLEALDSIALQLAQFIERTRVDRERAAAMRRADFLVEASAVLASSLEPEQTLANVAHLAIPLLADYCYVTLVNEDGSSRRIAIAHVDPAEERRAQDRQASPPLPRQPDHPVFRVLKTRAPVLLYPSRDPSVLESMARSPKHLEELRRLEMGSWLGVPLVARGRALGVISFIYTVSHREHTEQDVVLAVEVAGRAALALDAASLFEQMEEAVRTRDMFLAAASHDLKNPIAAIRGFVQLMRRRVDRSEQPEIRRLAEPLAHVDAATTKMTGLINELLDITRMQMGRPIELDIADVDLVALTHQVAEDQSHPGEGGRLRIHSAVPSLVGRWDALRLERVLTNLLSNALKYSVGRGEVTVQLRAEGAEGDEAIVSVRDRGIGIPDDDLPHVFERFRRASNVAGIAGSGIGLANARLIVELHGGSIEVESHVGQGSVFTVRLPLDRAVAGPEITPSSVPAR